MALQQLWFSDSAVSSPFMICSSPEGSTGDCTESLIPAPPDLIEAKQEDDQEASDQPDELAMEQQEDF